MDQEPLISDLVDDPDMRELIELFVEELPDRIAAIEAAITDGDQATLKRIAHQLKGASAGYGFTVIGKAAGQVESMLVESSAPLEEIQGLRSRVDDLLTLCRKASA
jgi:HPt (histidine-containing phosphotransfer) domain-containing protein